MRYQPISHNKSCINPLISHHVKDTAGFIEKLTFGLDLLLIKHILEEEKMIDVKIYQTFMGATGV